MCVIIRYAIGCCDCVTSLSFCVISDSCRIFSSSTALESISRASAKRLLARHACVDWRCRICKSTVWGRQRWVSTWDSSLLTQRTWQRRGVLWRPRRRRRKARREIDKNGQSRPVMCNHVFFGPLQRVWSLCVAVTRSNRCVLVRSTRGRPPTPPALPWRTGA